MPYSQIKKFKEIRRAEKELEHELGRTPSREEISSHLSKCVSQIDKVLRCGVHETSLDIGVGEDQETPLADVLPDQQCSSPEERLLDEETHDGLGEIFCQLNDQQKVVIAYRFGVLGERPLTLQETGERIGVSRERVRQIENQAKARMRKLFRRRRSVNRPPLRGARSRRAEASAS
jgi:RNA polymerase sigma factor (sigma-70 family)